MKKVANLMVLLLVAAVMLPLTAAPAMAAAPDHVQTTLEGCKLGTFNESTITCAAGDYTSGNLGKNWNELDLVPYRLTLDAGNAAPATQTYTIAVVLDNEDAGAPGYDVISTLTKLSGSCTFSVGSQLTTTNFGGIDQSIYRLVTVTQAKNTTCVFDFYGRLALGSHDFPGSALHANLANENLGTQGIGASDVSIPVEEIDPQELRKDMTAVQDADVTWEITKEATPAELDFGNTCLENAPTSLTTDITVTWTKGAAVGGDVLVTTHVYAKNPAHRTLTVNVTDEIMSGTTVLDTATSGLIDVPANTELLVLTHTTTVPMASAVNLNDEATATYTDPVTNVPILGTTTATATATVQTGTTTNDTATIQDVESITGNGLSFSVAAPSVGTFDGYVAGDVTSDPVTWNSGDQSASGSVTFEKTVYFAGGDTSGTLDDTATLTGSDGFTANATASVTLDAETLATLTINKTTSIPVDDDTDFVFNITGGPAPGIDEDVTVTILDGETSGSATLDGLEDGNYLAVETDAGGFTPAPDQQFTIDPGQCSVELNIENTFGPATAQVQKVTVPAGSEDGWTFNLYLDDDGTPGPSDPNSDTLYSTVTTTDANAISFPDALVDEGDYYILEVEQDGFVNQGGTGDCSFTVDYPADADQLFSCVFTNVQEATAEVQKVTDPTGFEAGWDFELFLDNDPAGPGIEDDSIATATTTGTGAVDFGVNLDAGSYYIVETPQGGWESNGGSAGCAFTVTYPADAGKTFSCTFTNTARGTISVTKTKSGGTSADTFTFELRNLSNDNNPADPLDDTIGTLLDTKVITANNTPVQLNSDLVPGTYTVCEIVMPGWSTTLDGGGGQYTLTIGLDNSRVCTDVVVSVENQDITLTVDNTPPPGGEQRTIGFWKNWASCKTSNGKQAPVLDQTLVLADPTGIVLGDLTLHAGDCVKARNILDKTTIDGKKKMASDPLFNMAAQLLAAKLNVVAGAGTCPAATTAITQASALLAKYHWNGLTYSPKLTSADAALANSLNTTLDKYNNGILC